MVLLTEYENIFSHGGTEDTEKEQNSVCSVPP